MRPGARYPETMATICAELERRHPALTVEEVADVYNVVYSTWYDWRANKRAPHKRSAVRLAEAGGLDLGRVLSARVRTQALLAGQGLRKRPVRG